MDIPDDLLYTREHEWLRREGDEAVIGVTDFAQSELGDLVFIEVETVGEELDREEVFGTVEAVKTTSELFMPVSGTVLEFNGEIDEMEGDNPALVNEDPYGEGWIIRIELSEPSQLDELMDAEAYRDLVE